MKRGALELSLVDSQQIPVPSIAISGEAEGSLPLPGQVPMGQGLPIYGERSVFLYAASGAAKEQWYIALSAETRPEGQEAVVRAMYSEYSERMSGAAEVLGMSQLLSIPMPDTAAGRVVGQSGGQGSMFPSGGVTVNRQGRKSEAGPLVRPSVDGAPAAAPPRAKKFGWLARLIPGRGGKGKAAQQPPSVDVSVSASRRTSLGGFPGERASTAGAATATEGGRGVESEGEGQGGGPSQAVVDEDSTAESLGLGRWHPSRSESGNPCVSMSTECPLPGVTDGMATALRLKGSRSLGDLLSAEAEGPKPLPDIGSNERCQQKQKQKQPSASSSLIASMAAAAARVAASADGPVGWRHSNSGQDMQQGTAGPPSGMGSVASSTHSFHRLSLPVQPLIVEWPDSVGGGGEGGPPSLAASRGASPSSSVLDLYSLHTLDSSAVPPLELGGPSPTGQISAEGGRRLPVSPSEGGKGKISRQMSEPKSLQEMASLVAGLPASTEAQRGGGGVGGISKQELKEQQKRRAEEMKKERELQQAEKKAEAQRAKQHQRAEADARRRKDGSFARASDQAVGQEAKEGSGNIALGTSGAETLRDKTPAPSGAPVGECS